MTYEELSPIPRAEAELDMASPDADTVCGALVRAALHDSDWRWVQGWALRLARDSRPQVRGCAVTSLGHVARLHGTLDLDVVVPLLEELAGDPAIGGRVEDALDDIRMFVGRT
jgi:hypothetical protein